MNYWDQQSRATIQVAFCHQKQVIWEKALLRNMLEKYYTPGQENMRLKTKPEVETKQILQMLSGPKAFTVIERDSIKRCLFSATLLLSIIIFIKGKYLLSLYYISTMLRILYALFHFKLNIEVGIFIIIIFWMRCEKLHNFPMITVKCQS